MSHTPPAEEGVWGWPLDDQTPVDISPYYVSKYPKGGLSYWVGAARCVGPTTEDWEQRSRAPIRYLLKVGKDAIHERLYYVLARTLNLPQQHVFWAVTPPYQDLVAVAIQFEAEAFFPKTINIATKTVLYRRKTYAAVNIEDFWRHEVLHRYCGTGDIHQAMVKGNVLFGIDAADCSFLPPISQDHWKHFLEHYHTHDPARLPVLREMMQRIADHPELPDLVEQELANASGPALDCLARLHLPNYGDNLREIHYTQRYTYDKQVLSPLHEAQKSIEGRFDEARRRLQKKLHKVIITSKEFLHREPWFRGAKAWAMRQMDEAEKHIRQHVQVRDRTEYMKAYEENKLYRTEPDYLPNMIQRWLTLPSREEKLEAGLGQLRDTFQYSLSFPIDEVAHSVKVLMDYALSGEDPSVNDLIWGSIGMAFEVRRYVGTYLDWDRLMDLSFRLNENREDPEYRMLQSVLSYLGYANDERYLDRLKPYLDHSNSSAPLFFCSLFIRSSPSPPSPDPATYAPCSDSSPVPEQSYEPTLQENEPETF